MLSNCLEKVLKNAFQIALDHKHEYVTFEHLLLALLKDKQIQAFFVEKKADINLLKSKLENYIQHNLVDLIDPSVVNPHPTAGFQRIIQRTLLYAKAQGSNDISSIDIMAEFFFEHESFATIFLKDSNISRKDLLSYRIKCKNIVAQKTNLSEKDQDASQVMVNDKHAVEYEEHRSAEERSSAEEILEKYCVNLNKQANNSNVDQLIGCEAKINRAVEILCRRKKNNVILVGEPGVGKTAIAEGMAHRIINKKVPSSLLGKVIYSLDLGGMLAGTKFRGEFEGRIKELLSALTQYKNAILFIDEIHTIVGAGASVSGAMDASNLLKPALTRGLFKCIGATTFKEYRSHFEQDTALLRRFQKIVIEEPNEDATLEILRGLKSNYEKYHNVQYDESALKAAVSLSIRYLHDKKLPDKAIDLIDEAGARKNIDTLQCKGSVVTDKDIEILIASIANIVPINVTDSELDNIRNLNKNLKERIFAQDEAIDILCSSIKMAKAGLRQASKPIGCYMFAGATGVGKTELARQLAHFSNMKLLKFDMSECSESSAVSKMIGSAPGYVGSDKGGVLTNAVEQNPYSVVLFDEIEKAHPEILNLLLQIMDDGKLTDNSGKEISFNHTIIILTTNVISNNSAKSIGFSNVVQTNGANMSAFEQYFSAEFRSRLDKIILFNNIDQVTNQIIEKNIQELVEELKTRNIFLYYDYEVVKYLNDNHISRNAAARDLLKAIDVNIKQAIADEILFGKLAHGGEIYITVGNNSGLIFDFTSKIEVHNKRRELEENYSG
jgi:ATP-dependent Clp protease ATP-binding subunit ClpA